jgi:hypothetical protein
MTIGVLHDPWRTRRGGLLRRYRAMVEYKANPRDEAYLRALFAERYPAGRIGHLADTAAAQRVVLLYPDAIGLGWSPVEREVRATAPPGTEIRVLNGRRRDFELDPRTRRQLAVRRVLEAGLVGEVIFSAAFLVATPILLAVDALRGRR